MLRVLNVLAVLSAFGLLYRITAYIWKSGVKIATMQMVSCTVFIPVFLYTTFIYGDVYGLALALAAVYAQMQYVSERKYRWMFLSVAMIAIATVVKMNNLIVLIAMVSMVLYDMLLV